MDFLIKMLSELNSVFADILEILLQLVNRPRRFLRSEEF